MRICVALGSNLGDRVNLIRQARDHLVALPDCRRLTEQAPLYESTPVDCPDGSGAFVNTVIEIEWTSDPLELLQASLKIEAELGRIRTVPNAPRPVDIDLICADQRTIATSELVLPHPRLHQRRFVLEPLAQFAPHYTPPGHVRSISEMLSSVQDQELRLLLNEW